MFECWKCYACYFGQICPERHTVRLLLHSLIFYTYFLCCTSLRMTHQCLNAVLNCIYNTIHVFNIHTFTQSLPFLEFANHLWELWLFKSTNFLWVLSAILIRRVYLRWLASPRVGLPTECEAPFSLYFNLAKIIFFYQFPCARCVVCVMRELQSTVFWSDTFEKKEWVKYKNLRKIGS